MARMPGTTKAALQLAKDVRELERDRRRLRRARKQKPKRR